MLRSVLLADESLEIEGEPTPYMASAILTSPDLIRELEHWRYRAEVLDDSDQFRRLENPVETCRALNYERLKLVAQIQREVQTEFRVCDAPPEPIIHTKTMTEAIVLAGAGVSEYSQDTPANAPEEWLVRGARLAAQLQTLATPTTLVRWFGGEVLPSMNSATLQ